MGIECPNRLPLPEGKGDQVARKLFKGGHLYFIGESEPRTADASPFVKIGIVMDSETRTSQVRMSEHQTGNPRRLDLRFEIRTPIVEDVETMIHHRFAPVRVGGEWFHLPGSLLGEVVVFAKKTVAQAKRVEVSLVAAEKLQVVESDERTIAATKTAKALHSKLTAAKHFIKTCDRAEESVRSAMFVADKRGEDVSRFIEVSTRRGKSFFDEAGFRKAHPRLWGKYVATTSRISKQFRLSGRWDSSRQTVHESDDAVRVIAEIERLATMLKPSDGDLGLLHEMYLHLLAIRSSAGWSLKLGESELKAMCGAASGIDGVCTWSRKSVEKPHFDLTAFRKDHPEKADKFERKRPDSIVRNVARDRRFMIEA